MRLQYDGSHTPVLYEPLTAIQLVKVRAEAMQLASELVSSGMMTVMYGADSRLGFACSVAKEFCQQKQLPFLDCRIASYLYPHCKVIAGNDEVSLVL